MIINSAENDNTSINIRPFTTQTFQDGELRYLQAFH